MYGSSCHVVDDAPPNGSKAVTFLLRISTLALALTSAVIMAAAGECTIHGVDGAAATVTFKDYPPFVYLVACNIAATILEVAAVYLQVGKGDDNDEEAPVLPRVVLVVLDIAVQVLLYSATGAMFAAVTAHGAQISACACAGAAGHFCEQVHNAKFICFGASFSAGLAAIAKDVPLPFSVWPISSSD